MFCDTLILQKSNLTDDNITSINCWVLRSYMWINILSNIRLILVRKVVLKPFKYQGEYACDGLYFYHFKIIKKCKLKHVN